MGRVRQRGEGNTEYVILLLFVLICAVVGLFSSYSGSIKRIQLDQGLCLDCTEEQKKNFYKPPPKPAGDKDKDKVAPDGKDDPDGGDGRDDGSASNGAAAIPPAHSDAITAWWTAFRDFISWWY
jgi:hypothetical protein